MGFLVLVIEVPGEGVAQLNAETQLPTKVDESIQGVINVLDAIVGGNKPATVQITTRTTDPSVTTVGTNSQQYTYSHL